MPKSYRRNADEMLNTKCLKQMQKPNAKYCMPKKKPAKNQMVKKCRHDLSSISTHRKS